MSEAPNHPQLLTLTADIVAAYVSNNSLKPADLPRLIADTHASLSQAAAPAPAAPDAPEFIPAVAVRKSLAKRDVILSMIDGKPYKTLRRHLSARGLTPDQYRERYGLAPNYPMVAPAYSEQRSETSKRLGLGRKRKTPAAKAHSKGAATGRRRAAAKQD